MKTSKFAYYRSTAVSRLSVFVLYGSIAWNTCTLLCKMNTFALLSRGLEIISNDCRIATYKMHRSVTMKN